MNSLNEEEKKEKMKFDGSCINFDVISKIKIGGEHFHCMKPSQKQKKKEIVNKTQHNTLNIQKEQTKNDNIDYTELDCYFKNFIACSLKYKSKHNSISNFSIKDLIVRKEPKMKKTLLSSKRERSTKKFIVRTKKVVGNKNISIIKIPKEENEIVDINNCNAQISSNNTGSEITHRVFFKILKQYN